jgi:cytochrome c-type biogenesis protein
MDVWISQILKGDQFGFALLAAAFLFGLSSAATTAACGGLPAMLVIVGYSGIDKGGGRRKLFISVAAFTLTSLIALGALGALASSFGGNVLQSTGDIGFYAQKAVGFVAIFMGLTALDMLPFRLPTFKVAAEKLPSGAWGAILIGLSVGIATAGCATACSPLQLPIVLSLAALRGDMLQGTIILLLFALGFIFPLVAVMLGLGMGKATAIMAKIDKPLRIVSGIFLIALGFWFLSMSTLMNFKI